MRYLRISWAPLLAAAAMIACSRTSDLPKRPLGQAAAAADTTSGERGTLPAAARAALEAYREAGRAAPGSAAPYFGIYMAAQKLGKTSLADSASALIQVLSGNAAGLSDNAVQQAHTGAKAP
jgi:hypothetical protein